jgi:ribosome-associated protein
LEQLSILTTRRKRTSAGRLTRNSKLFKSIINAILEKKGENIISLDLRKIPEAVADFFIICEASSSTQVKAIADYIEFHIRETLKETPYRTEGQQSGQWVLVDFVNVVVHVMQTETRKFYRLEEMWSDADGEEHNG